MGFSIKVCNKVPFQRLVPKTKTMESPKFFKSTAGKIMLAMAAFLALVALYKSGVHFGQWLFVKLH